MTDVKKIVGQFWPLLSTTAQELLRGKGFSPSGVDHSKNRALRFFRPAQIKNALRATLEEALRTDGLSDRDFPAAFEPTVDPSTGKANGFQQNRNYFQELLAAARRGPVVEPIFIIPYQGDTKVGDNSPVLEAAGRRYSPMDAKPRSESRPTKRVRRQEGKRRRDRAKFANFASI